MNRRSRVTWLRSFFDRRLAHSSAETEDFGEIGSESVNAHVSWEEMCVVRGRCGRERRQASQSHDRSGVAGDELLHTIGLLASKRSNLPRHVQNSSREASKYTLKYVQLDSWQSEILRGVIDYETHRLHFVNGDSAVMDAALTSGENWVAFEAYAVDNSLLPKLKQRQLDIVRKLNR
jgi:hypothetical protein